MPVHRKKNTTPLAPDSTQEQKAPALPEQQVFQQYVRELARAGIRVVLEGVMCEELVQNPETHSGRRLLLVVVMTLGEEAEALSDHWEVPMLEHVAWRLSGPPCRISACTKSLCQTLSD